ncbi:3'(2'):5'-bisphosphate nucleotidase 1-like protein [Leptotrombidium deliense]|uniref:3'(2'),5'-bisphosphate nucleotidase 1 n=1 Tax=Leptotrombidium deliense TaxID=299467 RepID=A0A443SB38_9ACAR|nr:3'(2'):5'-bisphosphate nucleotidase 1-like protein [Leptotrombidium deliense]
MSLLIRLIAASVSVSNKAGMIIRDIMRRGELNVVDKGINDLQTEADRSAQRLIVSSLTRVFPKITVIGEETLDNNDSGVDSLVTELDNNVLSFKCPQEYADVKDEDIVVWVDPLDGTSEYTQGLLDHVTVLIGVAVKGEAVAGVIHQPYYNYKVEKDCSKLGRTIWGLVGLGAFGINKKQPEEGKRIVTTTRSHGSKAINEAIKAINPHEVIRVGGAGHKVLLVIEGEAHAYVFPSKGCKKWDICAPEALLRSIGGKLTDVFGNNYSYLSTVNYENDSGVLATYSEAAHQWYVDAIPVDIKASLLPKNCL